MSKGPQAQEPLVPVADDNGTTHMNIAPPDGSHWKTTASATYSTQKKYWLLRPGALTTGLRQQGKLDLTVVREYQHDLTASEAWMLKTAPKTPIWTREISMSINGINSVFARSFTPLKASHGVWRGMRGLHTRPLADMLYHDPDITRSPFFVIQLNQQQPLYQSVHHFLGSQCPEPHHLLARCSIFWHGGQPLAVAECFLPDFWLLANTQT